MTPDANHSEKIVRAAIVGATGYTGAELVRILTDHPNAEITCATSRQYAGKNYAEIYPAFTGLVNLKLVSADPAEIAERADVAFTALPHKLPMEIVPKLLDAGLKVVDLSADFRFQNQAAYEAHYEPHLCPELLAEAVYGLCEVYGEEVEKARLVGNPGCYPTSTLLPLIPFVRKGLVDPKSLVVDSKSGVSGAGRGLSLATHFCEVTEGFSAYKVASHRHNPEIEEVLSREAGTDAVATFVPHLVPMSRGMLTTSYSVLKKDLTQKDAEEILTDSYKNRPFARVLTGNTLPQTRRVRGTNICDMAARVDQHAGRLILVSAIDNLVKGASGQAVQNMNLMFDLPETTGLDKTPQGV